jgi:hypothetical protein
MRSHTAQCSHIKIERRPGVDIYAPWQFVSGRGQLQFATGMMEWNVTFLNVKTSERITISVSVNKQTPSDEWSSLYHHAFWQIVNSHRNPSEFDGAILPAQNETGIRTYEVPCFHRAHRRCEDCGYPLCEVHLEQHVCGDEPLARQPVISALPSVAAGVA